MKQDIDLLVALTWAYRVGRSTSTSMLARDCGMSYKRTLNLLVDLQGFGLCESSSTLHRANCWKRSWVPTGRAASILFICRVPTPK